MSIKRYGKTYKNAEEIYNFIKDKKGVVLISIDDLEQKDQRIAELEKQLAIRDKALELACIKIEYLRLLDTVTVTVKKFKEIDVKSFEQRYKERKEDFVEKARKELEDD